MERVTGRTDRQRGQWERRRKWRTQTGENRQLLTGKKVEKERSDASGSSVSVSPFFLTPLYVTSPLSDSPSSLPPHIFHLCYFNLLLRSLSSFFLPFALSVNLQSLPRISSFCPPLISILHPFSLSAVSPSFPLSLLSFNLCALVFYRAVLSLSLLLSFFPYLLLSPFPSPPPPNLPPPLEPGNRND